MALNSTNMEDIVRGLQSFYSSKSAMWDAVRGMSSQEMADLLASKESALYTNYGVVADTAIDGTALGYSYPATIPMVGADTPVYDSNIQVGEYSGGNTFTGNVPANFTSDGQGQIATTAGPTKSGITFPAVVDKVGLAVAGVNIGAKLGLKIDEALYSIAPDWWDEHLPAINPQTWDSLVGVNPVGDFFLRTLFGISGDSTGLTGYISEDLLSYYYMTLRDNGAYTDGGDVTTKPDGVPVGYPNVLYSGKSISYMVPNSTRYMYVIDCSDGWFVPYVRGNNVTTVWTGNLPQTITSKMINIQTGELDHTSVRTITYGSSAHPNIGNEFFEFSLSSYIAGPQLNPISISPSSYWTWYILTNGETTHIPGLTGVTPMTGATQYPPTAITGTTPSQVLQELKQEYPDLFIDPIVEKTLNPDGSITERTYIPIPWVTEGTKTEQPTTEETKTQTDYIIDPVTQEQITQPSPTDVIIDPPPTGEGDTPVPAIPTGSASSLWAIYNPTQAQVNAFGAWLWSSDFVEQLKKLFNDPMQAIIGIHKVFATPSTGGTQTIKCGYLDSGVSSAVVTSQYTSVDCGSANLREYFGNVFDYDPYTRVSLFLPFIGVVPLNVSEVMRSTVSVKYKVDVLTGACLAEVSVKRDNSGGILYTYSGSAIVSYPVSSGSYMGVVQAALSTAMGIGSAIATGGASLGVSAAMVMSGISRAKTQVQHSGQFSGAAGAMGGKKPYLIIIRPQTRTPEKINEYAGYPSNAIHKLSECTGYTRVREVHVASVSAYDNELAEIETLLKTGVII